MADDFIRNLDKDNIFFRDWKIIAGKKPTFFVSSSNDIRCPIEPMFEKQNSLSVVY